MFHSSVFRTPFVLIMVQAAVACALAANLACDLVIAAANIYYLEIRRTLSQRCYPSECAIRRTDKRRSRMNEAVKLLVMYTLNTCTCTCAVDLQCAEFVPTISQMRWRRTWVLYYMSRRSS